jgi:hypothetical protein
MANIINHIISRSTEYMMGNEYPQIFGLACWISELFPDNQSHPKSGRDFRTDPIEQNPPLQRK